MVLRRLAAAAILLLLAGATFARAAEPKPLVLGLLLPPDEPERESIRRGVETAIEEANGGGGRPVSLAVRGKKGAWGSDASEAALLVMDDGAEALIAPPNGAASHVVLQVSGKTAVPVVTLCTDTSVTTASLPWVFRVAPSSLLEAETLFAKGAPSRWIAFVPTGRAGREAASDLRRAAAAAKRATTIEKVVEIDGAASQLPSLRELLSAARPDGALLWLDAATAARLARELRSTGFAGPLAGPMRLASPGFTAAAGPAAEGFLVPSIAGLPNMKHDAFEARFRRRFGEAADPAALFAHDAALFLVDRLRRPAGNEAGRSAPPAPLDGASGPLAFDRYGNRLVLLSLRRWSHDRLVPAEEAPR